MRRHDVLLASDLRNGRLAGRLEEAQARTYQERGREPPERAQAEAHSRQALTLAKELGMRPLQAHCHCGLGSLYATSGQREQARAALSTAIELYRTMAMTFWLPQGEAALEQVDAR